MLKVSKTDLSLSIITINRFMSKIKKKIDKITHEIVLSFKVVWLSLFPVKCAVCTRLGNDMDGYHGNNLFNPPLIWPERDFK